MARSRSGCSIGSRWVLHSSTSMTPTRAARSSVASGALRSYGPRTTAWAWPSAAASSAAPPSTGWPRRGAITCRPRLGFPDNRFAESYTGVTHPDNVKTNFSPYIMSNFQLRGFEVDWLPRHDFSFGLGYGEGMFGGTVLASEGEGGGDELDWYGTDSSRGWMAASAVHIGVGETAILNLIGEYNGWDVNAGLQLDYNGIRVGGFILGANYKEGRGRSTGAPSTVSSRRWPCAQRTVGSAPQRCSIELCPTPSNCLRRRPTRSSSSERFPRPPPGDDGPYDLSRHGPEHDGPAGPGRH